MQMGPYRQDHNSIESVGCMIKYRPSNHFGEMKKYGNRHLAHIKKYEGTSFTKTKSFMWYWIDSVWYEAILESAQQIFFLVINLPK